MLESLLTILAMLVVLVAAVILQWKALLPAPDPAETTVLAVAPKEFIAGMREAQPPIMYIDILDAVSATGRRYRFRYRTTDAGLTFFETTVKNVYTLQRHKEPYLRDLHRLYRCAEWTDYCTEFCGWCRFCVHTTLHEGWVKNPNNVLEATIPDHLKPFMPPD